MRRRVLKFTVGMPDEDYFIEIEVPQGAVPLYFGIDGRGIFCLWAEISDGWSATEKIAYKILPTGEDFNDEGTYVQTVIIDGFPITTMWHVYKI
jgi:hypothetical protein